MIKIQPEKLRLPKTNESKTGPCRSPAKLRRRPLYGPVLIFMFSVQGFFYFSFLCHISSSDDFFKLEIASTVSSAAPSFREPSILISSRIGCTSPSWL